VRIKFADYPVVYFTQQKYSIRTLPSYAILHTESLQPKVKQINNIIHRAVREQVVWAGCGRNRISKDTLKLVRHVMNCC